MSDLREALTAAMNEAEKEPVDATPTPEPEKQEVTTDEQPKEEKAEESGVKETAEKEETQGEGTQEDKSVSETPADKPVKKTFEKAPTAWKAGARERWATLPQEVREEILRRERDVEVGMRQNAEGRKFQETFQQVVEPFRPAFAAEGVTDPIVGIRNLLQTANSLRFGAPAQKADIVAELIQHYGVDPMILDHALSQRLSGKPSDPYAPKIQEALSQELAPIKQFMTSLQQQQMQRQQEIQQKAASAVVEFGEQAEFFNDVREDMADLMEVAARRGREMTLQEAYDRACQAHPMISKIMSQRQLRTPSDELARKRQAASSIKGAPGATTEGAVPKDLRGAIAQSIEKLSGR